MFLRKIFWTVPKFNEETQSRFSVFAQGDWQKQPLEVFCKKGCP